MTLTSANSQPPPLSRTAIPLWVKVVYTLFVLVLVPVYWPIYGPANFLWFCDMAVVVTAGALWLQSPLLASIEAVAMTLPQTIWILDFVSGGHFLSGYMFDASIPWYVRGLSTFHIWLPFLLLWMVWRLGYDRRALLIQTCVATAVLLASYLLTDPAHRPAGYPAAAVNVNRVFGPAPAAAQTRISPWLYLGLEIAFWPICFYLPTHLIFRRIFPAPRRVATAAVRPRTQPAA